MRELRCISFKGEKGKQVNNVLKRLPKRKVSEFVVDAIAEKIVKEVERIKSRIDMWKDEITKTKAKLEEAKEEDKPYYQGWIRQYERNIRNDKDELCMFSSEKVK